jgi:dTMP kinase
MQGRFITLEGIDGAGKSTHLQSIAEFVGSRGFPCIVTREPGGTALGERIRALLLDTPMHPETETLLMFAARREHLATVVEPQISAGTWVICDRFTDATFAYQGAGRGVAETKLLALEQWTQAGRQPDLTLLFDLPTEIGRQRSRADRQPDRFERERDEFFQRVRQGYLRRAAAFPERIKTIDASGTVAEIKKSLEYIILRLCI